jgi:RraA family protein
LLYQNNKPDQHDGETEMPSFLTTDLCDAHEDRLQVAEPLFQRYGGTPRFAGQIVTLKLFEDNSLVREALGEDGHGKVLVVDGGGSLRCALLGDQLGELAVKNGWAGVLVYGCIRDSVASALCRWACARSTPIRRNRTSAAKGKKG